MWKYIQANSFIEVGVRESKRQVRAILPGLQDRLGFEIDPTHPGLVWRRVTQRFCSLGLEWAKMGKLRTSERMLEVDMASASRWKQK